MNMRVLINNKTTDRCLILSKSITFSEQLKHICNKLNFQVDIFNKRKNALRSFMQYRHFIFFLESDFLPRFPYRLIQFFKMAHRIPGVIILNSSSKDLTGFEYLNVGVINVLDTPFDTSKTIEVIINTRNLLQAQSRKLFIREIAIFTGFTIPFILYLIFYLI